ncbi:FHA domain-containing protein [Lujinxingia sediminis]|uniref:FHA domain-containing protein n=1 Tax=Lujinxingia sediminis TaxID=2480984 RepID=A0ABY0CXV0_9DELT|nr:ATPase, T2SS/T4P/T4SS family [Lujinxingia sediminis]RVU48411.1 FHA domain-containing protein [Lujinxingia sediminis]
MFSVIISEKGGQQSRLDFDTSEITIGRMKGNDIVLPKGNVSKQHTRIVLRDNAFFIVDLKSTNGTYVNGRKVIAEQPVGEADKIYIGDFILQVEQPNAAANPGPPMPPLAPGRGIPPQPPQAPGGPPPMDRHFPTVMDGPQASGFGVQPQSGAQQPFQAPQHSASGPQATPPRAPSFPGAPMTPPTPTPPPAGALGQDVRQTYADIGAHPIDADVLEVTPEVEPLAQDERVTGEGQAFEADYEEVDPFDVAATPTPTPQAAPQAPASPEPPVPSFDAPAYEVPVFDAPAEEETAPPSPLDEGVVETPGPLGIRPLATRIALEDEFDPEGHMAQVDVARVFFERVGEDELPLSYPPEESDRARFENTIDEAIEVVGPSGDREALIETLLTEAVGLGPVESYLDDPEVQAIYVNRFDRIILRRGGKLVIAPRVFSHPEFLTLAARRLLGPQDGVSPADEVRFGDGTRVHIVMPPLAVDGPVLSIRKPRRYQPSLDELAAQGTMSAGMADFLRRAVEAGRSIVIAGPTSSGKTTLLNALSRLVPESSRLIAIEEHSSLNLDAPTALRLEANPAQGYDMRYLLRGAVAMHPQRIVLDECRGAEAYDWVTAAASGTEGSMLTLHGSSAIDALGRLESLSLLGATDLSPRGLREQVARSVNLVVVLHATSEGGFRVQQISEVQGVDLDTFRLGDVFYYRVEGGTGEFYPTGYIPMFYEDLRHAGVDVDLGIFRE